MPRTTEEVCQAIGADRLFYQDLDDLIQAVRKGNPKLARFDCSVFTGEYVTQVSADYLATLERRRNDSSKTKRDKGGVSIDLYNSV